ncbi:hypothetical protein [Microcoleus sp. OTE_8_concoct_300]
MRHCFIDRRSIKSVDAIAPYFFMDRRSIRGVDAIANVPEAICHNKNY